MLNEEIKMTYDELIERIEQLEREEESEESFRLLVEMKKAFPQRVSDIEYRILEFMIRMGWFEAALDEALSHLLQVYDKKIEQWIFDIFYEPFCEEAMKIYQHNVKCLQKYEHYYGVTCGKNIKNLLYDGDRKIVFYDSNKKTIVKRTIEKLQLELKEEKVILVSNMINIEKLSQQIHETRYKGDIPNYEVPIYLYYEEDIFEALIQCIQIDEILKDSRVVLIVGKSQLDSFFSEEQVIFPEKIVGTYKEEIIKIIKQNQLSKLKKLMCDKTEMEKYYAKERKKIIQRIRQGKPRILFLTSHFTTAVKYHTRDLREAAEKKGLKTELLKEKGAFYRVTSDEYYAILNSFRPDMIVCIDHFRFEKGMTSPCEVVWVCWTQDPVQYVMDKNTPKKLGNNDFVLNHLTTWKEFYEVGYSTERLIDAPIPSNEEIYKPYVLSEDEQEKYSCDICFVCHASDVDAHIIETIKKFPEEYGDIINAIYKTYQMNVYRFGHFFYTKEEFKKYIVIQWWDYLKMALSDDIADFLAEDMYLWFNQRVFRETLVDWILEAGFKNVKLWGNGWEKNPKYSRYAMGLAENGEILSKIYQASKVVIGNNILTTAAARAWETMLSGGFYLSNYIPPEADITDIRKIVEVDKDVIMFFDREDLIQKLHYYLEHEEERKRMAAQGRKVALEKMTFGRLMEKMLKEIADRL